MALKENLDAVIHQIEHFSANYSRPTGSVSLLAVTKTQSIQTIRDTAALGQRSFGENYLQEALEKIDQLIDLDLDWHFIGHIQSNKTKPIAMNFSWVHTVDSFKVARRLNDQRPEHLQPLNICVQVNLQNEESKAGVTKDQLAALLDEIKSLPRISVRGLMGIPQPSDDVASQRLVFSQFKNLMETMNQSLALNMDTLSMGMSDDMEAAIAEGATIIRIGSAIFGQRAPKA